MTEGAAAEELARELRERGLRLTPQRQLVLAAVGDLGHATPEAVCERVQHAAGNVNMSTVYRTLELLEKLGLVTHTHLGPGAPVYHRADVAHHLHLVCRDCGAVSEAPVAAAHELLDRVRDAQGFEVDVAHLSIYGRCAVCAGSRHG